ncbi:hypothetical protein GNI_132910 [Gregarina niphandrodes]|uniref:Transmembrane protein n=1 Tax=Gregarina niphandrodes TaxID=110365 RepID=A0A023B187_GRENI|nr:hypothetical protein GNI_132910 [Gregarina niphandrodes]EZG46817.1 hypothetical protein GNI_132910 [Gregarina niphandrodes]|eukprot:XP_011132241.1 hypothetical protein GNI_132910 [Gregarina niphandrodes]
MGRLFCGPVVKMVQLDVDDTVRWDKAIEATNMYYRSNDVIFILPVSIHHGHLNVLGCSQNCHHHVAMVLNLYGYLGKSNWNPLSVLNLIRREGKTI